MIQFEAPKNLDCNEQIIYLAKLAKKILSQIGRYVSEVDCIDIFCFVDSGEQGSFSIAPRTLKELVDMEIELVFDLYLG